jgi:hypothetical protein
LKAYLEGEQLKAWRGVAKAIERFQKSKTDFAKRGVELAAAIDPLTGRFPRELAGDLHAALDAGDQARFEQTVGAAHERPKTWLASVYFGW